MKNLLVARSLAWNASYVTVIVKITDKHCDVVEHCLVLPHTVFTVYGRNGNEAHMS